MSVDTRELKFTATQEKGEVSVILARPGGTRGSDGPNGSDGSAITPPAALT